MLNAKIRRTRPDEAPDLGALTLGSKAFWGYDGSFMEACRLPLTVQPNAIVRFHFYALEEDRRITGFYGLSGEPPRSEIEFCLSNRRAFTVAAGGG